MINELKDYILSNKQNAVLYKANYLVKQAGEDLHERDKAFEEISEMLTCIKSDLMLEGYSAMLAKSLGVKSATLLKKVNQDKEVVKQKEIQYLGDNQRALPKWINKDRYYNMGFDWRIDTQNPDNTGMYFPTSGGALVRLTNFVMTPLFHVYSKDESNRRFTEVNNGRTKSILELSAKIYTSADQFENALMDEGVYFCMDGFAKSHLNKLKSNFLPMYPKCYELKTLGWQPEGFFAFSNLVYRDSIVPFNEYGVAEVDDVKFLSMGASNALKDVRAEDDLYQNDKFLYFYPTDLSFKRWSEYMIKVYQNNGMMGVAWIFLAVYKDLVFKRDNNCPIPYPFGAVQSGKTKFAESVANVFTREMPGFNLNQGTEFAFRIRLERFRNVPTIFNEFDENAIKDEWFRAFKGAFDGEGREKGAGRNNKAKTQQVNCLPVIVGQFLSTRDDNSLLTRTLPAKFVENNNRPPEQVTAFNELKEFEKRGISGILTEVFSYRKDVTDNYNHVFEQVNKQLRDDFDKAGVQPKNRIISNYCSVLTLTGILCQKIELGFTYEDFYKFCYNEIVKLNNVVSESNSLAEFWKMVEFLLDEDFIEDGWDFKIITDTNVVVARDRDSNITKTFDKPVKLLYIRFNNIYNFYSKEIRNQGKKPINDQTILTYLRDQDYYVGNNPGSAYRSRATKKGMNTSGYVLNYEMLNVNLERSYDQEDERVLTTLEGYVQMDAKVQDIIGNLKVVFTLYQDEPYDKAGIMVERKVYTRCFLIDIERAKELTMGTMVEVTGMLSVTKKGDGEFRSMQVNDFKVTRPVFKPEQGSLKM